MDDTCVVDPRYSGSICGIYLCDFRIFELQLSGKVFTKKRIRSALTLLSFFSTQLIPTGFQMIDYTQNFVVCKLHFDVCFHFLRTTPVECSHKTFFYLMGYSTVINLYICFLEVWMSLNCSELQTSKTGIFLYTYVITYLFKRFAGRSAT